MTNLLRPTAVCAGLLLALGCSSDPAGPGAGAISGSVTVIGDPLPDGYQGGDVYLLLSPESRKTDAVGRAPLQGGPRVYTFSLARVAEGTYYLEACLRFAAGAGCSDYSTDPAGNATALAVRSGRTTEAQIRF